MPKSVGVVRMKKLESNNGNYGSRSLSVVKLIGSAGNGFGRVCENRTWLLCECHVVDPAGRSSVGFIPVQWFWRLSPIGFVGLFQLVNGAIHSAKETAKLNGMGQPTCGTTRYNTVSRTESNATKIQGEEAVR